MSNQSLKRVTYLYLLLPILIFMAGWIKVKFLIFLTLLLTTVIVKIMNEKEPEGIAISKKNIIIIFMIVLGICIWGGIGGFFYQSADWYARNTILRDLINYKWPVYYESNNTALSYYIGIWMFPALVGKIFLKAFGENTAWFAGNIALLIWCTIGITLSIIWISKLLNAKSWKKIVLILGIFLLFSGLDFIGNILRWNFNPREVYHNMPVQVIPVGEYKIKSDFDGGCHLERWTVFFQFSSMITQIFWVFNQSIVPWLITIVFIGEKKVNKYLLLISTCLAYGPLPFVGLIPLMAVRGIKYLIESIKNKKVKEFMREVFSLENVIAFFSIFLIYALYYSNNSAITTEANGGAEAGRGIRIMKEVLNLKGIFLFIQFYIIEIGVYGLILWKDNKKNELFLASLVSLIFIPLIAIGTSYDFGMRASIPALVIIDFYFVEFILKYFEEKNIKSWKDILLYHKHDFKLAVAMVVFGIGLITPGVEFYRGIAAVQYGIKLQSDSNRSLANDEAEVNLNFLCKDPKENSFFFKYIAKE